MHYILHNMIEFYKYRAITITMAGNRPNGGINFFLTKIKRKRKMEKKKRTPVRDKNSLDVDTRVVSSQCTRCSSSLLISMRTISEFI